MTSFPAARGARAQASRQAFAPEATAPGAEPVCAHPAGGGAGPSVRGDGAGLPAVNPLRRSASGPAASAPARRAPGPARLAEAAALERAISLPTPRDLPSSGRQAHTAQERQALLCLVPPYMLHKIRQNGSPGQRLAATHALGVQRERTVARQWLPGFRRRATVTGAPAVDRAIYSADNAQRLPGRLVRKEGDEPSADLAVDEAYDGLGATFNFYAQVLHRNSIDDAGMKLAATVHFDNDYNNAYWNSAQMVFGDGDGKIFNRFTTSLDVIGHELTHGVTQHEARLTYAGQSGALNESLSDVFGSLVKQYALQQRADEADWLIGSGLLAQGIQGVALRSMKAPGSAFDDPLLGKDPQPMTMAGFVQTTDDNGGVHINSGIPNYAFFKAAEALGGHAWDKAGNIWYSALRDKSLTPDADFTAFAIATVAAATRLYGADSAERRAVEAGWQAAGVASS